MERDVFTNFAFCTIDSRQLTFIFLPLARETVDEKRKIARNRSSKFSLSFNIHQQYVLFIHLKHIFLLFIIYDDVAHTQQISIWKMVVRNQEKKQFLIVMGAAGSTWTGKWISACLPDVSSDRWKIVINLFLCSPTSYFDDYLLLFREDVESRSPQRFFLFTLPAKRHSIYRLLLKSIENNMALPWVHERKTWMLF